MTTWEQCEELVSWGLSRSCHAEFLPQRVTQCPLPAASRGNVSIRVDQTCVGFRMVSSGDSMKSPAMWVLCSRSGLRRVSLLLHSRLPLLKVAAQLPTVLEQGSLISEPRTGTGSRPVRNWAAQEMSGRQASEASSAASHYSHFCLNCPTPPTPLPVHG